jgi:addiction module RelB/DinJ family antitoxin
MSTTLTKSTPTLVQIKLDTDLKEQSKAFFEELGLSFTDGIKIYLKYVYDTSNLPIMTPSPELEARIDESMTKIKNGTAKLISFDSKEARNRFFFSK